MGAWFRSRVGLALIGAIVIGCIAAVVGASTLAINSSLLDGALANGGSSATATAQSTETPVATVTPEATTTPRPTATTAPRPTATPLGVGSTLHGTVSGAPGTSSFVMSRNGVHYTIQVTGTTTYVGGVATKLSDIQSGWRATIRVGAVEGTNTYQASNVAASPDN